MRSLVIRFFILAGLFFPTITSAATNTAPTFTLRDGRVATDFGFSESANSVTVQADGKILVAGYSYNNSFSIALARYNTDGSLDASFGTSGLVKSPDSGYSAGDRSVTVQTDGKILVASTYALLRYHSNGSLDTSFGTSGIAATHNDGYHIGSQSVIVQVDGKILVAGSRNSDFALARYKTDGGLDTSFDVDGMLTTDFGGARDYGFSVALQADSKILVAGASGDNFALARYNSDGSLDTSSTLSDFIKL